MIKKNRVLKTFLEIARIPGLSKQEGRIAAELAKRLKRLGVKVGFDRALAGEAEVGNLIGHLQGNTSGPPLLLNAHMDTVGPIENWGFRRRGDWLESKGKSILGADDRSGVAVILEVVQHLIESRQTRPDLEIVLTIAEEIGLMGAKALDCSAVKSRYGIVLDSDSPLDLTVAAPEAYKLTFRVHGKSAHAGVAPESGLNAIAIAARAIGRMRLGRIDFETTANLGIISGGNAANIVPDLVEVRGEARSHDRKKLQKQIAHMRGVFKQAVMEARSRKFPGLPRLEEEIVFDYPVMKVSPDSVLLKLFRAAAKGLGYEIVTKVGGGGSDANIFNAAGIECVILGSGMDRVHTTEERLNLGHLYLSAQMLARVIELYPSRNRR